MAGIINFNNYASKYYIKGEKLTRIPFSKFQWTVGFQRNDGSEEPTDLTYIAKSVDLPGWEIQQQILNQYNKKRVVNTSIALKPVSLVFLDTVDGKFRQFIQEYMNSFSYNFSFFGAAAIQSRDQLSNDIDNTFGIFPQSAPDDNFLKTITINQEHGGEVWAITLQNPKIISVTHDQLDYSQNNGFVTWTISVQPEAVVHYLLSELQPDYVTALRKSTITEAAESTGGNGTSYNDPEYGDQAVPSAATKLPNNIVAETHGDPDNVDGSRNSLSPINISKARRQDDIALDGYNEPGYMGAAYTGPGPANVSDAAVSGLDINQAKGAVSGSMNNMVNNANFPTAALGGIQDKPGGSIASGFAINAGGFGKVTSGVSGIANQISNATSGALGAVSQVTGIAYALTQIPGLNKYTKGPIANLAKTGMKLRMANNLIKSAPATITGLQKYITGFDPKSIGGKWL